MKKEQVERLHEMLKEIQARVDALAATGCCSDDIEQRPDVELIRLMLKQVREPK
jgi:hypothetical protein